MNDNEAQKIEQQLRNAINDVQEYLKSPDDKFDIQNVFSSISALIQMHPQQEKILMPDDIGVMVSALRERYGTAIIKAAGKKKKSKSGKQIELSLDEINALGFGDLKL